MLQKSRGSSPGWFAFESLCRDATGQFIARQWVFLRGQKEKLGVTARAELGVVVIEGEGENRGATKEGGRDLRRDCSLLFCHAVFQRCLQGHVYKDGGISGSHS